MRLTSIRHRLLLALIAAMCAAMLLGGWATYRAARHEADTLFDYQLRQVALWLRDRSFHESAQALAGDEALDFVIRVWDRDGLTIYASRRHRSLPEVAQLGLATAGTSDGQWRTFTLQYQGMTISVAQPMSVRNRLAADAAWRTLWPFFVLLPGLAALVWMLVGRGLRPLARLAAAIDARRPESLQPLAADDAPEELQPLIAALNDLLGRLQASSQMQRAFVADAAHELRTPLTALQLQVQLVERAPDAPSREAALAELKNGLLRTAHTVRQMLTLARQEPGAAEERSAPVDLIALIERLVVEHERLAEEKGVDLGVARAESVPPVTGDPEALHILFANLLSNALRHTPAGGRIDIACFGGEEDGRPAAVVEVADSGPGIPPDERRRVFDRFYRAGGDAASGETAGSGLGLSIVQRIAERHGATVSLDAAESGGLRVRVTLPVNTPARP